MEQAREQADATATVRTGWFSQLIGEAAPTELPVLSETLILLDKRLGDERTARGEIGRILMRDPAMALRVLVAANNAPHLHLRHEVATLEDTLAMLGTDRMVRMVSQATVADTSLDGTRLAAYRRGCAQAVLAALLASDWALCDHDMSPPEVGLAALLYPLGELFLIAHGDPRIGRYLRLVEQYPSAPHECEYVTLGESLEALGQSLAVHWNLPELVRECMRASNALYPRALFAMLATQVARHAFADPRHALPATVLGCLASRLGFMPHVVEARIDQVLDQFNSLAGCYRQSPLPPFAARARADAHDAGCDGITPFCLAPRADDLAACRSALAGGAAPDRDWVIATLCRGLRHGLGLNRVIFAAYHRRARCLINEYTLGTDFEPLFNRFTLSMDEPDNLFTDLFARDGAFWLDDAKRDQAWPRVPARVRDLIEVPEFFAMPLRVGGESIGLIYADRRGLCCRLDARAFAEFQSLVAAAGRRLEQNDLYSFPVKGA